MKKTILTTSTAVVLLSAAVIFPAKAAASTDCATLGYTNTSAQCSDKAILKCPFDNNKIFCGIENSDYDCDFAYKRYNVDWSMAIGDVTITMQCPYSAVKYDLKLPLLGGGATNAIAQVLSDEQQTIGSAIFNCQQYREKMILITQRHNEKCPNKRLPTSGDFNPGAIRCNVCQGRGGMNINCTLYNCSTNVPID